jgi:hypothetical protein
VVAGWVKRPANLASGGVVLLLVTMVAVTTVIQVADRQSGGLQLEKVAGTSPTSPIAKDPTTKKTPRKNPSDSSRPAVRTSAAQGASAKFEHFKVTLRQVRREADVQVLAEVCVRSLPPAPQGDRTRISWDPWSIRTGSKNVDARRSNAALKSGFPPEGTYRVGECASGWIPFPTTAWPARIAYKNGVGDVAVWDVDSLEEDPRTN